MNYKNYIDKKIMFFYNLKRKRNNKNMQKKGENNEKIKKM